MVALGRTMVFHHGDGWRHREAEQGMGPRRSTIAKCGCGDLISGSVHYDGPTDGVVLSDGRNYRLDFRGGGRESVAITDPFELVDDRCDRHGPHLLLVQ